MALGKGLDSLIPQKKVAPKAASKAPAPLSAADKASKVWQIPLSEIVPNSEQPRKHFGHQELEDLVASIKKHGIMQPLTVTEKPDGGYELIAGERRFRASQIAGLATVPALVRAVTEQEKLELALIENIQRQQLNAIEEAFAFRRLSEEFGLTQEQISEQVGKSRSAIANTIRLLDLPEPIQRALIDGKLTAGKARALLSLKSEKEQLEMFKSMLGEQMNTRDVEAAVAKRGPASRKGSVRRDPNVLAQEELLEERFGTSVRIAQKGEKGTITLHFDSVQELKRLLEELS